MTVDRGPLLGRGVEVARLADALSAARAGRAAMLMLVGGPGIGKTRLAEESAALAEASGMAVAWGRAWEDGGTPAFWPWIQILRALEMPGGSPPDLCEAAPAGEDRFLQGRDGADARFALFDSVQRFVIDFAAGRPVLIVIDDLHAADTPSLELLAFAVAHLRAARVCVIATVRDGERQPAPRDELLERIGRHATTVPVGALAHRDSAALVERSATLTLDEVMVSRVHEAAEGNPLFVTEIARMLAQQPALSRAEVPVPGGVRALIRSRLERLPADRRALLEIAAVIGRDVSATLLASAAGVPISEVVAGLESAAHTGLMVENSPTRYRFVHGLFAEALRHDLPAGTRCQLHLRVADALEHLHGDGPVAPISEIARHLLRAGSLGGVRAIECARTAARRAIGQLAFEEAISLLEDGLAAAESVAPTDVSGRIELLLALGQARTLAGDVSGGQAACRQASALARSIGAAELLARAALGYGAELTIGATDRTLVELLEEAMAALPAGDSPLRARLLGRLAAALQPTSDPSRPMARARHAIAMIDHGGDPGDRLDVLHVAGASLAKFAAPAERLPIDEETLRLATHLGDRSRATRASARLVFDFVELGDLSAAAEQLALLEQQATSLRRPALCWIAPMQRAMLALYQGRYDDQAGHLEDARRWIAQASDTFGLHALEMHEIGSLRARGDDAALDGRSSALWRAMRPACQSYDDALRWMILGRLGRLAELRAELAAHDPRAVVQLGDPLVATWVAEAVSAARDARWADALFPALAAAPERIALQAMHGTFIEGPLARPLYLLADVLGLEREASAYAARALEIARRHGALPLEARIIAERGVAPAVRAVEVSLAREGEYWSVCGAGGTVRIRHSRGLDMLALLVAEPGREMHAAELAGVPLLDGGDAGEMIDVAARDAYRARLGALDLQLAEAETWNDPARADAIRAEIEALRGELARGLGLGGRTRRAGSAAERARVNVQRRLAETIRRITAAHAPLGDHLAETVRTGTWCSYEPARPRRRRP